MTWYFHNNQIELEKIFDADVETQNFNVIVSTDKKAGVLEVKEWSGLRAAEVW